MRLPGVIKNLFCENFLNSDHQDFLQFELPIFERQNSVKVFYINTYVHLKPCL
jgi:hypothetical protein